MLSHADLHSLPEGELPSEHREQIDHLYGLQERDVKWQGGPPVSFMRTDSATFVRADTSNVVPNAVVRAACFGAGGVGTALFGLLVLAGMAETVFLILGGLSLLGCVWALMQIPEEKRDLRRGPTRYGIYLLSDALIVLGAPKRVIHRPEVCGALMIPKGAITGIEVLEVRGEGSVHYSVAVRVRKTTGEMVDHPIEGYISPTRTNALATVLEQWRSTTT